MIGFNRFNHKFLENWLLTEFFFRLSSYLIVKYHQSYVRYILYIYTHTDKNMSYVCACILVRNLETSVEFLYYCWAGTSLVLFQILALYCKLGCVYLTPLNISSVISVFMPILPEEHKRLLLSCLSVLPIQ